MLGPFHDSLALRILGFDLQTLDARTPAKAATQAALFFRRPIPVSLSQVSRRGSAPREPIRHRQRALRGRQRHLEQLRDTVNGFPDLTR